MSTAQKILLGVAVAMAGFSFLFPAVQYGSRTENREQGRISVKFSTQTAFAMPLWTAWLAERRNTGNRFTDTRILWLPTTLRAILIAAAAGFVFPLLAGRPADSNPNGESRES